MKSGIFCAAAVLTVVLGGCYSDDNNYLRPADFAYRLKQDGIAVGDISPLDPMPVGAAEAVEMTVGKSGIGVYKFDRNSKAMRNRLERIQKNKTLYFNGIPYPVYEVHGSFVIVGLDKNSEKYRILESLRKFR